jgi:hypothetical protein
MCVQSLSWQLSFFFFFNEEKMASFLACKTTFIYITQSRTQLQRMVDGAGGGQLAQANRSANRWEARATMRTEHCRVSACFNADVDRDASVFPDLIQTRTRRRLYTVRFRFSVYVCPEPVLAIDRVSQTRESGRQKGAFLPHQVLPECEDWGVWLAAIQRLGLDQRRLVRKQHGKRVVLAECGEGGVSREWDMRH